MTVEYHLVSRDHGLVCERTVRDEVPTREMKVDFTDLVEFVNSEEAQALCLDSATDRENFLTKVFNKYARRVAGI